MTKNQKNNNDAKVFTVEAPENNYCGIGAGGVHFAYGKAKVCEGWVLDWYRERGYKITPNDEEKDADISKE